MAETGRDTNWLTLDSTGDVEQLLRGLGCLGGSDHVVDVSSAGPGNMNLTLRVRTTSGNFIVKQARPWVQKYPQIAAPVDRMLHEMRFYQTVGTSPETAARLPLMMGTVTERYVLVLSDLGAVSDCSRFYDQPREHYLTDDRLFELVEWLAQLHRLSVPAQSRSDYRNRKLRQLNHAHIFVIPFQRPSVIDLDAMTPGLDQVAEAICSDTSLVARCRALGELYLADGETLLHGDFFPGSWLLTDAGVKVIDPEFCFLGHKEFDLAIMTAHCRMIGVSESVIDRLLSHYASLAMSIDMTLVRQWAAVEILRRLLGVAQLPFSAGLDFKIELIDWSRTQLSDSCVKA